ncbi:stage V sporulation protein AC [Pelorhabdus rhamnosifermentans]|uniref:stage V sporulation protein AC n=1 Tax=Pelorhabdus rhamnosifermentans TaxID=2772457 RepID=UPI001FEC0AEF|nr:stage V sporulation protein AC [Pelorhabdus rhamnosifermentans]
MNLSSFKRKNLTPVQQQYQDFAYARENKRPILVNCIRAFVTGGTICMIGQGIQWFFIVYFNFDEKTAGDPTVAILILISVILTSLGLYDHIAQWGGAGTAVPVTGFANTITSAALDHKSEGFVLGVGGNMFKIAGPVIVFGVFSAFIVAIVSVIIKSLGGV